MLFQFLKFFFHPSLAKHEEPSCKSADPGKQCQGIGKSNPSQEIFLQGPIWKLKARSSVAKGPGVKCRAHQMGWEKEELDQIYS